MEISKHKEHDRIIELLEKEFIKPDNISLNNVYQSLIDYSKSDVSNYKIFKQKIGFTSKNCLEKNYLEQINLHSGASTFASDLPIYIQSKKQNAKTILVCAMDSLPPEPNKKNTSNPKHEQFEVWDKIGFDLKSNVGFWGPFSLLNPDKINEKDLNFIFFNELRSEYNLYVTDIYKLFFYIDEGNDEFSKSNSKPKYKIIDNHANILQKEIETIKPHCIITLGNDSRDKLLNIVNFEGNIIKNWNILDGNGDKIGDFQDYTYKKDKFECKIISSPHISTSANGTKTSILNNPKYINILKQFLEEMETATNKKPRNEEKMAKIIINKLKEI